MSDKEFDELFEAAPDWATAVENLRGVIAREKDSTLEDGRYALLKNTARETILTILADLSLTVKQVSHNRWTGGEIEFDAPSFHVFVLRKAFACYRAELTPPEAIEEAREAEAEFKAASERHYSAQRAIPPEMRKRGY